MADQIKFKSPFDKQNPQKRKNPMSLRIMTASQLIRSRNGWREQLQNGDTIDSWMEESIQNGLKPVEFTAVVDQLKYFDKLSTDTIEVGLVEGTRQANNIISTELKNEFVAAVSKFQEKSEKKDYDPGTDNLVVNLLDPRMYALITNVTHVTEYDLNLKTCLQNIGAGEPEEKYFVRRGGYRFPVTEFQLLPTEIRVSESGQAKINSYINNLHPELDAELYSLIERIFTFFVPLFNGVLHDLLPDSPNGFQDNITYLHGRDIQVIVKIKSIELSPEKPEFNGGDWHIEGEKEEHIVASGIYCFHTENISESCVDLRQLRGKNQEMGSLPTSENSLTSFPNICQHRSGAFKLQDPNKPGFRKILVFFLIDPAKRITSTRNVPPQQLDWFEGELIKIPPFDRIDTNIVRGITKFLECPYSEERATEFRNQLIKWRKGERPVFGSD